LTNFTFEFIRRPISPILSPSFRTFVELTQLCVIIAEAEEENKHERNEGVDRQVEKIREHNKKEKEKIHVLAGEWRIIMSAINHGTEVPKGSRREVLMGY
jgi:hypothetical protein